MWGADATHVDLMDAGGSLAGSGASYGGGGQSSRVLEYLVILAFYYFSFLLTMD